MAAQSVSCFCGFCSPRPELAVDGRSIEKRFWRMMGEREREERDVFVDD